jgi:Fuc2NAc and GlcNAc transferase
MSAIELSVLLTTFCASLGGSGYVRNYALRTRLLDIPNSRSSHAVPTPRGGGLSIVASFIFGSLAFWFLRILDARTLLALVTGVAVAWIGFMDDKNQLSARLRFGVHIVAAVVAVSIVGVFPLHGPGTSGAAVYWVSAILTVCAFAWATNLFNFMDGIDGLAGSEAIFVSAAGALLNFLTGGDHGITATMLCLCAATLGFLAWNWPPARLFMGDVGSGFLGFTLAVLALAASQRSTVSIVVFVILGSAFLIDASITLIRRMIRGDAWLEAHRTHAYQHLARNWRGHLPVTLLLLAINVIWLLPLAFYAARHQSSAVACLLIAQLPLIPLALWAGAGRELTD